VSAFAAEILCGTDDGSLSSSIACRYFAPSKPNAVSSRGEAARFASPGDLQRTIFPEGTRDVGTRLSEACCPSVSNNVSTTKKRGFG
jgi:hypothetical protein